MPPAQRELLRCAAATLSGPAGAEATGGSSGEAHPDAALSGLRDALSRAAWAALGKDWGDAGGEGGSQAVDDSAPTSGAHLTVLRLCLQSPEATDLRTGDVGWDVDMLW